MKNKKVNCTTVQHNVGNTVVVLQSIEEIGGRQTQTFKSEMLLDGKDETFEAGKTYEISFAEVSIEAKQETPSN